MQHRWILSIYLGFQRHRKSKKNAESESHHSKMDQKPHVVLFPSAGLGHLIPMMEFSRRLLAVRSLSVTFVTVSGQFPANAVAKLAEQPHTRSITLPAVDTSDYPFGRTQIETICSVVIQRSLGPLRSVLDGIRPVSAFVLDIFCTDAIDVVREFDIPAYIFFSSNATALSFLLYSPILHEEIQEEYRDITEPVLAAPGCPLFRGTELVCSFQDKQDDGYGWFIHHARRYREATGIMVNSFDELEPKAIKSLTLGSGYRGKIPPVYPIGPLLKRAAVEEFDAVDDGEGRNAREDDDRCLKWLDEQPPTSVLFVSFGSGGTMTKAQLAEIALGLEASGQRFLWVVRRPHSLSFAAYFDNGETEIHSAETMDVATFLPEGFVERTKELGMVVVEWAPQVEVLRHEAVGGFLSHCGWNSTLESIVYGVPMIAWPLYAEQIMNRRLLTEEIGVAVAVDIGKNMEVVPKEEVERVVRMLMEGEEGKRLRKRVRELSVAATAAVAEKGASRSRLERIADRFAHARTYVAGKN